MAAKRKVYVVVRNDVEDLNYETNMYGYCGVASTMEKAQRLRDKYIDENYDLEEDDMNQYDQIVNLYSIIEEEI